MSGQQQHHHHRHTPSHESVPLMRQHRDEQVEEDPNAANAPLLLRDDGTWSPSPPSSTVSSPTTVVSEKGAGVKWAHPLMRHISLQRYDSTYSDPGLQTHHHHDANDTVLRRVWKSLRGLNGGWKQCTASCGSSSPRLWSLVVVMALLSVLLVTYQAFHHTTSAFRGQHRPLHPSSHIIPIQHAQEHLIDIGDGLRIWCRTWGNPKEGIPVLFVHGGPGNAISDYGTTNAQFFDDEQFYVLEVDQRGTGKSQPSVRESCRNMKYYTSISIDQMSRDYEIVRNHFGIDKWLVFGGSWGSTLSLDYAMRYPEPVLGLIIRGIYLNTQSEFDAVYTRNAFLQHPKRLAEFDAWFDRAQERSRKDGDGRLLDPNDPKRFFEVYRRMLLDCDKSAIWHWYVFENNLMETVPDDLRDPYRIKRSDYEEAQSVAFFENVLFYHGTFEDPPRLLERLDRLQNTPVWLCQGNFDEVCPPQYAHELVDGMRQAGVNVHSYFVDAAHEAGDPVMAACLIQRVQDFVDTNPLRL